MFSETDISYTNMVNNTETVTTRFKNVFTCIFFCNNCTLILKFDHHEDLVEKLSINVWFAICTLRDDIRFSL